MAELYYHSNGFLDQMIGQIKSLTAEFHWS